MASPVVADTATTQLASGTSYVVNLPANIVSGNRLAVFITIGSQISGSETITATGWTVISGFYTKDAGNVQALHGLYRDADGTEGATETFTNSVTSKGAATAYRITGHDAATAPQAGTGATGSGAADAANPPSVSVTGGSKDILAIAVMAQQGETFTGGVAPTSYSNLITNNSGTAAATTTNGWIQTAQRQVTTATEDPAVFEHDSTDVWVANTVIHHPAGGGVQVDATQAAVTVAAQAATVTLAEKTIGATPATLAAAAQAASTTSAVTISATPATLTAAAQAATVTPGVKTIAATPATLTTAAQAATVTRQPPTGLTVDEIGVIGHSNVSTFVEGYQDLSSRDLLTLLNQGGADALVWGDETDPDHDGAWNSLVTGEPVGGYRAIWVMLGFLDNYTQNQAQREAWADHVYSQITTLFPTVEWVWWSPMNTYADPNPGDGDAKDLVGFTLPAPFSGANHTGPQQSIDLMFYAIAQGYADDYGPWINLTDALTDTDNRHPTEPPATEPTGMTHGAEILLAFFEGALATGTATIVTAAQAANVTLGAKTVTASPATLTAAAQPATVTAGAVQVNATPATIATAAQPATVTPAAKTILASSATLTTQAIPASVAGSVSVAATPATVAVSAQAATVTRGSVTINASPALLTAQAQALDVALGAKTVAASFATLAVLAQPAVLDLTVTHYLWAAGRPIDRNRAGPPTSRWATTPPRQ